VISTRIAATSLVRLHASSKVREPARRLQGPASAAERRSATTATAAVAPGWTLACNADR